jgi:mevalonate kinase
MDVNTTEFSAPGKIILFGEHAVVYGHPAIAVAIDLRARSSVSGSSKQKSTLSVPDLYSKKQFDLNRTPLPENLIALKFIVDSVLEKTEEIKFFDIEVKSQIPSSVGLGSSAAVSVAMVASLSSFIGRSLSLDDIKEIAHESEKIIHSFPSGIDTTISTYGGGILYENCVTKELPLHFSTSYMVIINSQIQRLTKDIVENVKKKHDKDPVLIENIFNNIHNLVIDAEKAMNNVDLSKIGELMSLNHKLLRDLGVSNNSLDMIVNTLNKNGALGSKLTGAGGGGCVISLYDDLALAEQAIALMKENNFQAFITSFSTDGVRNES